MTDKEALAMAGTEFTYKFPDGDTIECYIKKLDKKIGMTCLSLECETVKGWAPEDGTEPDGTFCVMAYDFTKESPTHNWKTVKEVLEEISKTGVRDLSSADNFGFGGSPACAF